MAQLPVVITEDDVIFSPDFIPVLQRAHARIVGQLDVREMAIGHAARRAEADTGNAIRSADPAHGHAFIINLYSPSLPGNASTLLRKYSVQAALGKLPKVKYSLRYGGIAWGYGVQVRQEHTER